MTSTLHVEVAAIDRIEKHPNADLLELAIIKGWQVVVQKGQYQPGAKVVYVPPDSVLPEALSDELGITQYLSKGRVKCIKLRGEPSFGLIISPKNADWAIGQDVADELGITKYAPPVRAWETSRKAGTKGAQNPHALPEHSLFWRYTNIENLRHFPHELNSGEEVVITEKLHGTNSRVGIIDGVYMAGSHRVRRKHPNEPEYTGRFAFIKRLIARLFRRDASAKPAENSMSLTNSCYVYWFPVFIPGVQALLSDLAKTHKQVILYGEILGDTIQSLHYGYSQTLGYRAFDLLVDGYYLDYDDFADICQRYGVETVPVLARGLYSLDMIKQLSEGKTTLLAGTGKSKTHIREGVVVRPVVERISPKIGRVILKYVSDSYLVGKATDFTEE